MSPTLSVSERKFESTRTTWQELLVLLAIQKYKRIFAIKKYKEKINTKEGKAILSFAFEEFFKFLKTFSSVFTLLSINFSISR